MANINENYDNTTKLSDWWPIVKGNFTALKNAADALQNDKVDKTQYASTDQAGIIKLHSSGSGNNSGIAVGSNGDIYINTNADYGTKRSGDGKLCTAAATTEEIAAETNAYKPIVPSTVRSAVEGITGAAADINNIENSIGQPSVKSDIVTAINSLNTVTADAVKRGNAGCINNSDLTKLSSGSGAAGTTKTALPDGVYFWVPDALYRSINGLTYTDADGNGLFKADKLYIIQLGATKRVLYSSDTLEGKAEQSALAALTGRTALLEEYADEGVSIRKVSYRELLENSPQQQYPGDGINFPYHSLFLLSVNTAPRDSTALQVNDEVKYTVSGAVLEEDVTYLCYITQEVKTGVDGHDGNISVVSEIGAAAWKLANFFSNGYYGIDEVTDGIQTNYAEINALKTYSTTPQKVGTWTDGTPVWRVGFPYNSMQNDAKLTVIEASSTVEISLWKLVYDVVKDVDKVNCFLDCVINYYSEYPDTTTRVAANKGRMVFCDNDPELFEDLITFSNGFWGGYIEFVTPESNIKTT